MEGSPGAAREPRVYGKPAGCSKWMRSYSRLGALVTKESARQYEEGQTDARSDECLPEVNCCKGLFHRAPRLADRVNSPAKCMECQASEAEPKLRADCLLATAVVVCLPQSREAISTVRGSWNGYRGYSSDVDAHSPQGI